MPLITLISDIGTKDFVVGAVKGRLLQILPQAQLIDISHELTPFNYPQAAYIVRNAIRNFPSHSYHLILVNLFENDARQLLLAYHQQQYLLCADNGLLTMILEERPELLIGIPVEKGQPRNTLHLTQLFAEAIQSIDQGLELESIGTPDPAIVEKNPLKPLLGPDWIEGQIIFIDHFENVVINITREAFEEQRKGRSFKIVFKRDEMIDRISETYFSVPEGEKLALFNSAGYLEIAVNKGNAAGLFGLHGFSTRQAAHIQNRLFYQTVRIFFD